MFSDCLTSDGSQIVSGSSDRMVRMWDLSTGSLVRELSGHERGVVSVCVSKDGSKIGSASRDKTVRLWDVHMGRCRRRTVLCE